MEIVIAIVLCAAGIVIALWAGSVSRDNRYRDDRIDSQHRRLSDLEQKVDEYIRGQDER